MPQVCALRAARVSAVLLAGLLPLAAPSGADAGGSKHRFDIPAQSAVVSLQVFARQSGKQLLFPYDAVAGKQAPKITGLFDDDEVLQRLTRAAGLIVVSHEGRTIILAVRTAPVTVAERGRLVSVETPIVAQPPAVVTELVVTALKRSEPISRAPASISVLRGEDLPSLGVRSVADIEALIPGVSVNRVSHGVNIGIRGVSTTDNTSKGEQGVAFNVDGAFVGRPVEQGLALFDLERVEVLRGPQGTLYGKSSTGGAVNVITRKPVDRFEAYAQGAVGNFDASRLEGAVNLPLADGLAVRVAGAYNHHEGYFWPADGGQRKGDQEDLTGRLSARLDLGSSFTARATLTAGHVGGAGAGLANLDAFLERSGPTQRQVLSTPFPAELDHHFSNFDGEAEATLGSVRISYLGARRHFSANELSSSNNDPLANDQGSPPATGVYAYARYLAVIDTNLQEMRFTNAEPGLVDYVAGANAYHETLRERDHEWGAPVADPSVAASQNRLNILGTTTHASYGVFAQTTIHATARLGLVAGLRYSDDQVERRATLALGPTAPDGSPWLDPSGAPCAAPKDCAGVPNNGDQSADKLTYRLGVNIQASDGDFVYVSIASGYKAGGFNDIDYVTRGAAPYAPEALTAYEIGYKGRPAARLQLQSSAFYYDYQGAQITSAVLVPNAGPVIYTRLVPAEIYGLEAEATWVVSRDTSLDLTAAFEKSRYKALQAGFFQDRDWSGLSLDRTPRFVGSIAVNHAWRLSGDWTVRLRASSRFSTSYIVSDFVAPYRLRQDAFSRTDASLTVFAPRERWYAQAFVQNLEDDLQAVGAPNTYLGGPLSGATVNTSDPRLIGLRMGFNFH